MRTLSSLHRHRPLLVTTLFAAVCLVVASSLVMTATEARMNPVKLHRVAGAHVTAPPNAPQPWLNYTQVEYTYDEQLIDHFNASNVGTFSQRYWIVDQFWANVNAPVLFMLCGEYTCPGVMSARLWPLELAYEFGALVVVAEHRFYGQSIPLGGSNGATPTEHLYLLNSRQALHDFAQLQQFIQASINSMNGATGDNQWFVVGGSYPGALSAWYRVKFPELVVASLSSSGVVNAILDFPQFDEQVARSAGPDCTAALQKVTAMIEASVQSTKKVFGVPADMNDGDFFFMMADAAAESVQYGYREPMCTLLLAGAKGGDQQLFEAFVTWTKTVWMQLMGNDFSEYDRRFWADPVNGGAARSWGWQTCTEVGFWQVAPAQNSIRSARINMTYYSDLCSAVFGLTALPDVNGTNAYYGGAQPDTTNVFFVNGVEDPWQWAGVRKSLGPTLPAVVVDCPDCAHCVDLYTPTSSDNATLVNTRQQEVQFLTKVLQQPQQQLKKKIAQAQ